MIAPSLLERHLASTRVPVARRADDRPGVRLRDPLRRRHGAVAADRAGGSDSRPRQGFIHDDRRIQA